MIYVQYELRCDCRGDNDPYGCEPAVYANTRARVWQEATDEGWKMQIINGRLKHFKPGHAHE